MGSQLDNTMIRLIHIRIKYPEKAADDVGKQFIQSLKARLYEFESAGTTLIQEAIQYLNVYASGNLATKSKMKMFGFDRSIIWRFFTEDEVDYAVYPRNGLGTSRAYGPRKYDLLAAVRMLKRYGLPIEISEAEAGSPRTLDKKLARRGMLDSLKDAGFSRMQSLRIYRKAQQKKTGVRAYQGVQNRGVRM